MADIKLKISEYFKNHQKLTLATVTAQGKPLAHTVEYVSDGEDVYFATRKDTRKVENIRNNSHIACTVDEDYTDWMKIQGVQMEGEAFVVSDEEMINRIYGLYIEKFPFVAGFPPNPDLVFIRIKPRVAHFLDYEKGFSHRDRVTY